MSFECEIKILDIDVNKTCDDLIKLGAQFLHKTKQRIYTYDLGSIYYRFLEIKELIKSNNKLLFDTNLKKLEILFIEIEDLLNSRELDELCEIAKVQNLMQIINKKQDVIVNILENDVFLRIIKNLKINPNKWLRLRDNNGVAELTVKHVFEKNDNKIQKVAEFEINTSSFEETNCLLNELGFSRRNYQEKIRYHYKYKNANIEIDVWPMLKPYLEIETNDNELMEYIVKNLNLDKHEIVSLNTEELYKQSGIDVLAISELKF